LAPPGDKLPSLKAANCLIEAISSTGVAARFVDRSEEGVLRFGEAAVVGLQL
jgi:hypothetical protein